MRRLIRPAVAVVALAASCGAAAQAGRFERSHLEIVRPGRARALPWARAGTEALREGDAVTARRLLDAAVREDPLLAAAWANLSAAQIQACQRAAALFSSLIAGLLAPELTEAAGNRTVAAALDCPAPTAPTAAEQAEWAAEARPDDPTAWIAAAAERRAVGDHALAILYEDVALARGAAPDAVAPRIAQDLQALGLWRAAAEALESAGRAEEARPLRARLATIAPNAERIGGAAGRRAGLRESSEIAGAVLLAEVLLALSDGPEGAEAELEQLLGVGRAGGVTGWWGELPLRAGWAEVRLPAEPSGPDLVLRRFPWDTQLAFFRWPPAPPEIDLSRELMRRFASQSPAPAGPLEACATPPAGATCRTAAFDLDLGQEGLGRIVFFLVGPTGASPNLLLAALAGSGGCGDPCRAAAETEIAGLVSELKLGAAPAASAATASPAWRVPTPVAWQADRVHRESEDPWRRFVLGDGLVLDAPPGVTVGTVTGPVEDERLSPFTRLWLRGRFVDKEGREVVIGGVGWAGWVDVRPGEGDPLAEARQRPEILAPRSDPDAAFVRLRDLGPALDLAAGADDGVIARFEGARFPGVWYVVRLRIAANVVDLALPIAAGEQSPAAIWTAVTVRRERDEAAPPPVDLTSRFQVRFLRGAQASSPADPREGRLVAGELELAVARGWRVSLNPTSRDGFPVTLRGPEGGVLSLEHLPAALGLDASARQRQVEALRGRAPAAGWRSVRRIKDAELIEAEFAPATSTERPVWVLLVAPREATASTYRLTLTRGKEDDATFATIKRLVAQSLRRRPLAPIKEKGR